MVKSHSLILSFMVFTGFVMAQVTPAFEQLIDIPRIRDLTMNNAGTEAWFTVQSPLEEISAIAFMVKVGQTWSEPHMMPFSGVWKDMEPFLSPDGLHLYFISDRPLDNNSTLPKDMDIWMSVRLSFESPWGVPRNMGPPVNTAEDEFYPAIAANGNLYFTRKPAIPDRMDDLYVCEASPTGYKSPVTLSEAINTAGYEYNAYIAPDESYLIFGAYNRPDGLGSGDLYISYKGADGQWQQSTNLGPGINGPAMDYCPFVHPTTGTLYFTSRRSNLTGNKASSLVEFLNFTRQYENGFSRLYQVPFTPGRLPERP
ncbi:MAG: hypothetical protein K9I85_04530 [Saprospiraceae bacterium]|nr:hypothetical protein [Saprospiraceae bacterium]